jgi:hypothetical protein
VNGHQAHDVSTPRLDAHLLDERLLAHPAELLDHLGEGASLARELARRGEGLEQVSGPARSQFLGRRERGPAEASREARDRRSGRKRAGEILPLAQLLERPADPGIRLDRRLRPVVEASARSGEPIESLVVHAEERAAEGREEENRVVGIGDGSEERQERVEFLGVAEGAAARDLAGHAVALERPSVFGHVPALAEEDQEVSGRAAPPPISEAIVSAIRRESQSTTGAAAGSLRGHRQPEDGGRFRSRRMVRGERDVGRLLRARLFQETPESAVDPVADVRGRSEVRRELEEPATARDPAAHGLVSFDVRAPKPVDRLLGIAHDEEGAGNRRELPPVPLVGLLSRQEKEDLRLDGIGVLELVHEDRRESLEQRASDLGVVAQEIARVEEKVLEVQLALAPPPLPILFPRVGEQVHDQRMDVFGPALERRFDRLLPQAPGLGRRALYEVAPSQDPEHADELGGPARVEELAQATSAADGFLELRPAPLRRLRGKRRGPPREEVLDLAARREKSGSGMPVPAAIVRSEFSQTVSKALLEIREADPEREELREARIVLQVQLRREALPGRGAGDAVLRLVHLDEAGLDARLDRALAQQAGAEGVDRSEKAGVEARERGREPLPARRVQLVAKRLLERALELLTELRRGLDREGHGRETVGRRATGRDQGDHAIDEARGLARTGSGLDEDRRAEVLADGGPSRVVGKRRFTLLGHASPGGDEDGIRSVGEFGFGATAGELRAAADRLEVAVPAVALGNGVRKHPRGDEIEEARQNVAGRLPVGSRRDPLAFTLPAGKK